jgi:hypothetical protein
MTCRLASNVFVLAVLFAAAPALGQQESLLRGLSEASVNVSHDWTEADGRCGIREADIKPIVSKAWTDGGLKMVDDSAYAELLVNLMTLETDGTCVSSVRVALRGLATATLLYDARKQPTATQVLLREESTMLLSPASQHGARFRDRVRALADRIAAAVRAENQQ